MTPTSMSTANLIQAEMIGLLDASTESNSTIARKAEISLEAIKHWRSNPKRGTSLANASAVLDVLGYELRIVKKESNE